VRTSALVSSTKAARVAPPLVCGSLVEAASREKYRLGMDIRDGLGQHLAGLSSLLAARLNR